MCKGPGVERNLKFIARKKFRKQSGAGCEMWLERWAVANSHQTLHRALA